MALKNEPNNPGDPLYSNRVEDKFILNRKNYDEVVSVIQKNLTPYYPAKSTEYTDQKSVYFETPDLKLIQDHLKDLDNRFKVRQRYYAPNGKQSTESFLEVKYREDGDQRKVRIRLDSNYAMVCLTGKKPLPSNIAKINEDLPEGEYDKSEELINKLFTENTLSQISEVSYRRESFKNKVGTVRVTVDNDIVVVPRVPTQKSGDALRKAGLWDDLMKYKIKFHPETHFIVEIKYEEGSQPPGWFTDLMNKYDDKFEGMSKFAFGLAVTLK